MFAFTATTKIWISGSNELIWVAILNIKILIDTAFYMSKRLWFIRIVLIAQSDRKQPKTPSATSPVCFEYKQKICNQNIDILSWCLFVIHCLIWQATRFRWLYRLTVKWKLPYVIGLTLSLDKVFKGNNYNNHAGIANANANDRSVIITIVEWSCKTQNTV